MDKRKSEESKVCKRTGLPTLQHTSACFPTMLFAFQSPCPGGWWDWEQHVKARFKFWKEVAFRRDNLKIFSPLTPNQIWESSLKLRTLGRKKPDEENQWYRNVYSSIHPATLHWVYPRATICARYSGIKSWGLSLDIFPSLAIVTIHKGRPLSFLEWISLSFLSSLIHLLVSSLNI